MGSVQSSDNDWETIGRETVVEKAKNALKDRTNCLQIIGMKKIGKSKVMIGVHEKMPQYWVYLYQDFSYDLYAPHWYDVLLKLCKAVNDDGDCEDFKQEFPNKTFQCDTCDNCQQSSTKRLLKCTQWTVAFQKAVTFLITTIKHSNKDIVLLLDNVDKLMSNADFKDCFLKFVSNCKSNRFKIVISTTKRINLLSAPDCLTIELEPLSLEDTIKLIYITTDGRDSDELVKDTDVDYNEDNDVFTPENKKCLECIAKLCDGLPLAAIMAGSILTEDDNMISPVELLEILTFLRMKTLSPDNCPPDDRLDIYSLEMKAITSLDEQFSSFFESLNEKNSTEFTIEDALNASGDKSMTPARMKQWCLKILSDHSILSVKKLSKQHQWRWHSILREASGALTVLEKVNSESGANTVMKFMRENVEKIGLEFDEKLSDPKKLEQAIRSLSNMYTEETPDPKAVDLYNGEITDDVKISNLKDLQGDVCNNFSIGDQNNLLTATDEVIYDRNTGMNIREPMEHSYVSRNSFEDNINAENKKEARYVKEEKNKEVPTNSDVKLDFEVRQTSQNDRMYECQHTLKANDVKKLSNDDVSPIEQSQAEKLEEYNRKGEDHFIPSSSSNMPTEGKVNNIIERKVSNHTTNYKSDDDRTSGYNPMSVTSHHANNESKKGNTANVNMCNNLFERNITNPRNDGPRSVQEQTWCDLSNSHELNDDSAFIQNVISTCVVEGELSNSGINRTAACNRCLKTSIEPSGETNHLGECPMHGLSFSGHSVCSYTGPPALQYEPPVQQHCVNVQTHVNSFPSEPSLEPLTEHDLPAVQSSRPQFNANNTSVQVISSSISYNSQTGPGAMSYSNSQSPTSASDEAVPVITSSNVAYHMISPCMSYDSQTGPNAMLISNSSQYTPSNTQLQNITGADDDNDICISNDDNNDDADQVTRL